MIMFAEHNKIGSQSEEPGSSGVTPISHVIHDTTLVTNFQTLRDRHYYLPLNIPVSLSRFSTPF